MNGVEIGRSSHSNRGLGRQMRRRRSTESQMWSLSAFRGTRAVWSLCFAAVISLSVAGPVSADLGPCHQGGQANLHQKGDESHSNIYGIYAEIVTRNPNLCDQPPVPFPGSASTGYVMVWLPQGAGDAFDNWLQIGYVEVPEAMGTSPHFYLQYSDGLNVVSDDVQCTVADPCTNAGVGTRYRYVIKRLSRPEGPYWHSYVLRDSDGSTAWNGIDAAVADLRFTPSILQYASEAVDRGDQSGGSNAARMRVDTLRWYEGSALTVRTPDIQGTERTCDLCGGAGPCNINWINGSTFEVWTDGF